MKMFEEMLNSEEKISEESDDKVINKNEITKLCKVHLLQLPNLLDFYRNKNGIQPKYQRFSVNLMPISLTLSKL